MAMNNNNKVTNANSNTGLVSPGLYTHYQVTLSNWYYLHFLGEKQVQVKWWLQE